MKTKWLELAGILLEDVSGLLEVTDGGPDVAAAEIHPAKRVIIPREETTPPGCLCFEFLAFRRPEMATSDYVGSVLSAREKAAMEAEKREASKARSWAAFGKLVFVLACVPLVIAARAYVARALWVWFITQAFQLQAPPYYICYGLLCMYSFVRFNAPERQIPESEKHSPEFQLFVTFLATVFAYVFGWVVATCGPYIG